MPFSKSRAWTYLNRSSELLNVKSHHGCPTNSERRTYNLRKSSSRASPSMVWTVRSCTTQRRRSWRWTALGSGRNSRRWRRPGVRARTHPGRRDLGPLCRTAASARPSSDSENCRSLQLHSDPRAAHQQPMGLSISLRGPDNSLSLPPDCASLAQGIPIRGY